MSGRWPPRQPPPTGVADAQDTIDALGAQGYHVIVNKLGTVPLDQSPVVAVRCGQT